MSSDLKQLNKLKKNSRRNNQLQEPKFVERLIKISRVSKVTKGGKKLSFRAIVVLGDENGKVGVGVAKADDVVIRSLISFNNNRTLSLGGMTFPSQSNIFSSFLA